MTSLPILSFINTTSPILLAILSFVIGATPIILLHLRPRILLTLRAHSSRRRLRSGPSSPSGVISSLYIHPIKSLQAIPMSTAILDEHGLKHDRRLMIVRPDPRSKYFELDGQLHSNFTEEEPTHRFFTQRQCPRLALLRVSQLDGDGLSLEISRESTEKRIRIDLHPDTLSICPRYLAGIWNDAVVVADVGDEAASFVAGLAAEEDPSFKDVRVVAILGERRVDEKYCPDAARVGFGELPMTGLTDGFPILIATESSLAELNRRLSEKGKQTLPMSRFRPNIVISNTEPFEEDNWKAIQIGSGPNAPILHITKGCPRCKQSCTDQLTGERTEEPLETLAEFRALGKSGDVYFAQNAVVCGDGYGGRIRVGDEVRVLKRGDPVWDLGSVDAE